MTPRDTGTGAVLEAMILPALKKGGYTYETQVRVGDRLGCGRHVIDVIAKDITGTSYLISLKWQQVSGTAEQKVPFEIMCLTDVILNTDNEYERAYVVLGGGGWKLRELYVAGGLGRFLTYPDLVQVVDLETFVAKANTGRL